MGGCQNYGPFFGTLNIRGRIIIRTQKGTIILTTNHIGDCCQEFRQWLTKKEALSVIKLKP